MFSSQDSALFLNFALTSCDIKSSEPRTEEVNEVEHTRLKLVTVLSCCEQCAVDSC